MSLFDGESYERSEREYQKNPYQKHDGTEMPTEVESAEEVLAAADPGKPLKPGGPGHKVLLLGYGDGQARTAYDASKLACGDWHGLRRETRRLFMRGYVALMPFTLPNRAPRGRGAVEAWRITEAGRDYLKANPWSESDNR